MSARRFATGQPVTVTTSGWPAMPCRFHWRGRTEWVAQVEATWAIQTGWWHGEAAVSRRYYRLCTTTGLFGVLYQDLTTGRWYLEQLLD
jgi:hypothetical protein